MTAVSRSGTCMYRRTGVTQVLLTCSNSRFMPMTSQTSRPVFYCLLILSQVYASLIVVVFLGESKFIQWKSIAEGPEMKHCNASLGVSQHADEYKVHHSLSRLWTAHWDRVTVWPTSKMTNHCLFCLHAMYEISWFIAKYAGVLKDILINTCCVLYRKAKWFF